MTSGSELWSRSVQQVRTALLSGNKWCNRPSSLPNWHKWPLQSFFLRLAGFSNLNMHFVILKTMPLGLVQEFAFLCSDMHYRSVFFCFSNVLICKFLMALDCFCLNVLLGLMYSRVRCLLKIHLGFSDTLPHRGWHYCFLCSALPLHSLVWCSSLILLLPILGNHKILRLFSDIFITFGIWEDGWHV